MIQSQNEDMVIEQFYQMEWISTWFLLFRGKKTWYGHLPLHKKVRLVMVAWLAYGR
jgi:hypothetical protein